MTTLVGSKKLQLILLSLTLIILLNSCADKNQINESLIEGPTMGTRYKIVIKSAQFIKSDIISNDVKSILNDISNQMSTYSPESEISIFNKLNNKDIARSLSISEHFLNVIDKSFYYHSISDGMFDITIHPLYELWGFQNKNSDLIAEPSKKEINKVLDFVGMDKLSFSKVGYENLYQLNKKVEKISIDVNAIAKGYAVDVISEYIQNQGYSNYFIDIGGEIRVSSTFDNYWDIGIQEPDFERLGNAIKTVKLLNNSIATSGNYANFIEYLNSGVTRSHIINPKTGYPLEIKNGMISSVSIIAPLCVDADALATTLMLLSKKEGLRLIESIEDTEAYIIYFEDNNLYTEQSSGFKKYIYE